MQQKAFGNRRSLCINKAANAAYLHHAKIGILSTTCPFPGQLVRESALQSSPRTSPTSPRRIFTPDKMTLNLPQQHPVSLNKIDVFSEEQKSY